MAKLVRVKIVANHKCFSGTWRILAPYSQYSTVSGVPDVRCFRGLRRDAMAADEDKKMVAAIIRKVNVDDPLTLSERRLLNAIVVELARGQEEFRRGVVTGIAQLNQLTDAGLRY